MKLVTSALIMTFLSFNAFAARGPASSEKPTEFKFVFNPQKYVSATKDQKNPSFTIVKTGVSKDVAFKLAAKDCYQKLTGGKYPGEERGLDIIDICANPKM
ncbi:MAG: hypothetical protein H7256_15245 [Bdellovibrio sp.]|nr:hypothetical protein [Bdellovibrio sp.]